MTVITNHVLQGVDEAGATLACVYSDAETQLTADWIVPLTRREPDNALFDQLTAQGAENDLSSSQLHNIGDCEAPGTIAAAVYSGYKVGLMCGDDNAEPLVLRDMPLV